MKRHTVLLAGLLACGAVLLLWFADREPASVDGAARPPTEEPGRVLLDADARPILEGAESRARPPAKPQDPPPPPSPWTSAPRRTGTFVSFRLETVDVESGRPVGARWTLGHHHDFDNGSPSWRSGAVSQRAFSDLDQVTSYGEKRNREDVRLLVWPPDGYVPVDDEPRVAFHRAAGVKETWALQPLAREAVLDLRILGPDGRHADGAHVVALEVAGGLRSVLAESLGRGEWRLRGIPFLPGEPVKLALSWEPDALPRTPETVTEEVEEVIEDGIAKPDVITTIPSDLCRPWSVVARLPGPTPRVFEETLQIDHDLPAEEVQSKQQTESVATASLRVRVLDREGKPLAGASIAGDGADERGERVVRARRGPLVVHVREPGRFPISGRAELTEGSEAELVLREPRGARLEVLVTDEHGNPRPCARLLVSGAVFDVVDGVQRVDMFTDHRGARTFERVEPGKRTVWAHWGSRHGSQVLDLPDGETVRVTIVAK